MPRKRKNKFNRRKVTDDGITFDSKAEHKRYVELKELKSRGQILDFAHHPQTFTIQPAFRKCTECCQIVLMSDHLASKHALKCPVCQTRTMETFRAVTYTPDFQVRKWHHNELRMEMWYEDVKGSATILTEAFKLKYKWFHVTFPNHKLKLIIRSIT